MNSSLRIAPCSHKAALYAVENWHYSKCMPVGKTIKHGVWEREKYIGAVLYGRGASPYVGKQFAVKKNEVCELVRVALRNHTVEVTKVVSISIRILKNENPKMKILVSFADINQGHVGTIYQAGNWVYTGVTKQSHQYIGEDGKQYHQRVVTKSGIVKQFGRQTRCIKESDVRKITIEGKHKYVYILDKKDKRLVDTIAKMRLPYPKKAVTGGSVGVTSISRRFDSDLAAP